MRRRRLVVLLGLLGPISLQLLGACYKGDPGYGLPTEPGITETVAKDAGPEQ